MELADQLDWVAKFRLLEGYRERHGLAWSDAKLRAMDIQYTDMRPDKGLAWRVGLEQLVSDAEAIAAISEPPADTRAYFRGRCIDTFRSRSSPPTGTPSSSMSAPMRSGGCQ